jgi:hypothetical protein
MPKLNDLASKSWASPIATSNKARALHIKMARLARELKHWNRKRQATLRREYQEAQDLVLHLDQEQDQRQLTANEILLHKEAKRRILGMTVIRKFKLRQRLRLTWIRLGDANSRLFHLRANARWHHNHINCLTHDDSMCFTHEAKALALEEFYVNQLDKVEPRQYMLNWEQLRPNRHDLRDLDRDFTDEEVHTAVMQTPSKKHPNRMGM